VLRTRGSPHKVPGSSPISSGGVTREPGAVTARYSLFVRLSTFWSPPIWAWLIFGVGGLWNAWWAWAVVIAGIAPMVTAMLSPYEFSVVGDKLLLRWEWGRREAVDLPSEGLGFANPTLLDGLFGCERLLATRGRTFRIWPAYLSNAKDLRAAVNRQIATRR